MALPLDDTISAGQAGHIADHQTAATTLNGLSTAANNDIVTWETAGARVKGVTRAALAADSAFAGVYASVPVTADAVLFVSANGNDANDGFSWGKAKLTVAAAITALPAGGGAIEIGAGSFSLGSGSVGLTLTAGKPVRLRGQGRLATVLTYAGTGSAVKLDGTGSDPNDWGSIESLKVHCTANAATTGFELTHAHRGFLHDVYLLGNNYAAGSRGIHAQSAYVNYLDHCVVAGFATGVDLNDVNHDFTLHNVNIGAGTVCVRVLNSDDVRVHGGQHSGTGATVGLMAINTSSTIPCAGLEILEVHYESNGLDVAIGRVGDGSTQTVQCPLIATPLPMGATLDRCYKPRLMGCNIGDGVDAAVLTLTANCSDPILVGLRFAALATLTDSSTRPTIISDVDGRTGIGTSAPGSKLHVAAGDILLDNNQVLRFKDSGGTSRRAFLLTGGNAVMLGDIDNAMASANLIMAAGGTGTIQGNVNGTLILFANASSLQAVNAHLQVSTAGFGLKVAEGSNAKMGTATLVGGTVTVATTAVTATSRILLTVQSLGTVTAPKAISVTARTAGTSFTITSADATDTSVVAWFIVEPA